MNKDTQALRMIRAMKQRKVRNYEFPQMNILSYSKRISEIRERGFIVSMEKEYASDGKYYGVNYYWIPRKNRKQAEEALKYEVTK